MVRLTIGSFATATALTLVSLNALAQSASSAVTEMRRDDGAFVRARLVRYEDLNLLTTAGVSVLHRRLTAAADSVCLPLTASRELARHLEWRACRDNAVADAVGKIDHPRLTEYYKSLSDEG